MYTPPDQRVEGEWINANMRTFIWVRRFWNQNLTWRGLSPSSWLNRILLLSSGCGHSLNNLSKHKVKPLKILIQIYKRMIHIHIYISPNVYVYVCSDEEGKERYIDFQYTHASIS